MKITRLVAALAAALVWITASIGIARADGVAGVIIVASCGTPPTTLNPWSPTIPTLGIITVDTTGKVCVNATVNATVSGFQGNGNFGNLTATAASSASTALPTGTSTRITNASSTATVSCTEATGAATGLVSNIIIPPLSSVSRVNGSFDHIACIDQTGSTGSNLVVLEGGAGLGNDTGGGGGGGGSGGTVVQGNAGSNAQAWWTQIGDATNGPAAVVTAGANGASNTANGLLSYNRNLVFNGATWDRWTGAVTVASGSVASGAYAPGAFAVGSGTDGWNATLGAKADSVCGSATGTCTLQALIKFLNNAATSATPAGANLMGKVGIDQTTQGTTNGVTNGANNTNTVAASATAFVLSATQGGGTGTTGDYLSHCVLQPGTTSPGAVTIADNATTIFSFAGGASSVSNLLPMPIPFGAVSKSGGWKVTTGTNVTLFCVGKFS